MPAGRVPSGPAAASRVAALGWHSWTPPSHLQITSSGPSEGPVPQPRCRGSWEALEGLPSPSEGGHPNTGHHPGSAGRPLLLWTYLLCRLHLSPKPLLPEEARLPDVLSLCPSPPGGGKQSLCPEATCSLGARPSTKNMRKSPGCCGTALPCVCGLCLRSVSGVLSSSSLLFTSPLLSAPAPAPRPEALRQHLVGTGALPHPPASSTVCILRWGQNPRTLAPRGSWPGPTSFGEVPPQGQPVPHHVVAQPHQCLSHLGRWCSEGPGLRAQVIRVCAWSPLPCLCVCHN